MALWFVYGGLVVAVWTGSRPSRPDAIHTHPYVNHGVMYVSDTDLMLSRSLWGCAIVLLVIGLLLWNRHSDQGQVGFVERWQKRGMRPPW